MPSSPTKLIELCMYLLYLPELRKRKMLYRNVPVLSSRALEFLDGLSLVRQSFFSIGKLSLRQSIDETERNFRKFNG